MNVKKSEIEENNHVYQSKSENTYKIAEGRNMHVKGSGKIPAKLLEGKICM